METRKKNKSIRPTLTPHVCEVDVIRWYDDVIVSILQWAD